MKKPYRIPSWAQRLGLVGLLLLAVFGLLKIAGEAILEQEVQKWWEGRVRPFLFTPIEITIAYSWIAIIVVAVLAIGTAGTVYLFMRLRMNRNGMHKLVRSLSPPIDLDSTELTPTDVVNAIIHTREGRIAPQFLVDKIVIRATNANVIRQQAAAEILEEFGFDLILRSDGSCSYAKQVEKDGNSRETP